MFELSDLKQTKVYQEALAEGEEKGVILGRQQEGVNFVVLLLNARFRELPQSSIDQIQKLSIEQLENLGKALLNFASEEDLRQWLDKAS